MQEKFEPIVTRMFEVRYTLSDAELRGEPPIIVRERPWFPRLYALLTRKRRNSKALTWLARSWPHKEKVNLVAKRAQELDDAITQYVLNGVWNSK